jgi:hypothetical protein
MTSSFYLGSGVINTLSVSTSEVTGPFLLPEMVERLAGMLNYFLLYLAGPQRKMLKVRRSRGPLGDCLCDALGKLRYKVLHRCCLHCRSQPLFIHHHLGVAC